MLKVLNVHGVKSHWRTINGLAIIMCQTISGDVIEEKGSSSAGGLSDSDLTEFVTAVVPDT